MDLLELGHGIPGVAHGRLEFAVAEHLGDVANISTRVKHQGRRDAAKKMATPMLLLSASGDLEVDLDVDVGRLRMRRSARRTVNIRSTLNLVEILPSAHKHHVVDDDMLHAVENCIVWLELDDDPLRYLLAGPDRAGNYLELVILVIDGAELLIHAMPLRRRTAEELFGGEQI